MEQKIVADVVENQNLLLKATGNKKVDITSYSALNLAYIGDAVFEIFARTKVVVEQKSTVNNMNKYTSILVKATTQAKMYKYAMQIATEEEMAVLKRGRNAKSHTSAKNATISDYRHATGLEALFGYLYLKGEIERLEEIFIFLTDEMEKNNGYE